VYHLNRNVVMSHLQKIKLYTIEFTEILAPTNILN